MEQERVAYDVDEAAKEARVSRNHLYDLMREGKGPAAKKIGRRTIILREDLLAWLRSHANYKAAA